MLDSLSRRLFLTLAGSITLKRTVSRYGMRGPHSFARRFIGGQDVDEVIALLRMLEQRGFGHTLNYLGEHVATAEMARTAAREYLTIIDAISGAGLPCKISVKLSQIGLEINRDLCIDNLRQIGG